MLSQFGVEILPYHHYSLEESLREIASLGFKYVNLWSAKAPLPHHINPGDDPKEILALLDKYGLKPSGLSVYALTQDEIIRRIEFAGQLGIDTVIFHCELNFPDFVGSFLPPLVAAAEKNNVKLAIENHITVPFTEDFESGGHEQERWQEGLDTLAQIKRLVTELDSPNLGVCIAPAHLWVMGETISEVITFLAERKKLFYYYAWDIDRNYKRNEDGLYFGPGDLQLPRKDGTLDHRVLSRTLKNTGYEGIVSLCCHGTAGWPIEKITAELAKSRDYLLGCMEE
jgi:sugar phosphate isomerase/epimerase